MRKMLWVFAVCGLLLAACAKPAEEGAAKQAQADVEAEPADKAAPAVESRPAVPTLKLAGGAGPTRSKPVPCAPPVHVVRVPSTALPPSCRKK